MKFLRTKLFLLTAFALAAGFGASAQSGNPPGDTDYAQFSSFIAQRNIFDPNRYPHDQRNSNSHPRTRTRAKSTGAPAFTLVGVMTYQKGLFAFFDGNSPDLKKILAVDGEVENYTVKEITLTSVTMIGPDKKEFVMHVGDQMQQQGSGWQFISRADATPVADNSASAQNASTTTAPETSAPAPAADLGNNEILKRLMEKRAKENQ